MINRLQQLQASTILGATAGLISIILWFTMIFMNPYLQRHEMDSIKITFIMLCLPACLAILSGWFLRKTLMLTAFIWSLPISLYLAMTPGIFALFGITSCAYLIAFILMLVRK